MADRRPLFHPHILAPERVSSKDFKNPKLGRDNVSTPPRPRTQHAEHLLKQLREFESVVAARIEAQNAEEIEKATAFIWSSKARPDLI